MMRLTLIILVILVGGILAGGVFLATWDIPAPSATVEKEVPDDRFPR